MLSMSGMRINLLVRVQCLMFQQQMLRKCGWQGDRLETDAIKLPSPSLFFVMIRNTLLINLISC